MQDLLTTAFTATAATATVWLFFEFVAGFASQLQSPAPASQIQSPAPASQIQSPAPASQIQSPAPASQIQSPAPASQIQSPAPASQIQSPAPASQLQSPAPALEDLRSLGVRRLRKIALERGFKGAGRWSVARLVEALSAQPQSPTAEKCRQLKEACQLLGYPVDFSRLTEEQISLWHAEIEKGLAASWALMTLQDET